MRDELQRWLDGELPDAELPTELRAEAERLRSLLDTRREVGPAPDWIESRVMGAVPSRRPGRWARWLEAIVRPRTFELRPVTAAGSLVAAGLAILLFWPAAPAGESTGIEPGDTGPAHTVLNAADDGRVYVQFVYVAPEAGSVAIAGDFNEWAETGFELRDPDGDGVWTGRLPLSTGLHKYMFVVDGEWVTDPLADRYVDDGFGNRNALIDVTAAGRPI